MLTARVDSSKAGLKRCYKLKQKVRKAHIYYFGFDYPYWFSLAQLFVESHCRWILSKDGWGSLGYAQITPRFWDKELSKLFPAWKTKDSTDYFMSQAYILWKYHKLNKCKKLYITYQCYNRSCYKVLRENKSCSWRQGYKNCLRHPRKVCVWKRNEKCLQYRTNCSINYFYSKKIYRAGKLWEEWKTRRWKFW